MLRPVKARARRAPRVIAVFLACTAACVHPGATARVPARRAPEDAGLVAARDVPSAQSQAYALVTGLTDDAGARLAGSPGDARGVAWALRTLPTLGLTNVHAEPVTVHRWERRAESASIVSPAMLPLAVCALGHSIGTPADGLEAEVVRVASLEALDALPDGALAGKLAFLDQETPRRPDGSGYGETVGIRVRGASRASSKGAVGIVIRSVSTAHDRFPHTGVVHYADGVPPIPAAALSTSDADLLARLLSRGPVRLRLVLDVGEVGTAETANVIGDVRGASRPDEVVLLGAHLDSWDLARGAIDDGAGVGIVLEAARRIAAGERPPRTLRVVLFANEESGGDGERAYAAAHDAELPHHVLAAEADIGDGRALELRTATTPETRDAFTAIARALAPLGVHWTAGTPHGGSDLGSMHEHGVPVLDIRQDATRYFDNHHSANDTMSIVVREDLDHAASAYAALAWTALRAPGDTPFGRAAE